MRLPRPDAAAGAGAAAGGILAANGVLMAASTQETLGLPGRAA
jgi:hypothetical protein